MRTYRSVLLLMLVAGCSVASGCASSTTVPRPRPFPRPDWNPPPNTVIALPSDPVTPAAPGLPPPVRAFDGRAVAEFALGFRGVPYRLGGTDPEGFDCSGLVQYVFAQYGIIVPRVVEEQYRVGDDVKPSQIKPGDLLFFSTKGPGASHVAIAVGENRFVHAPNSTGVVRVEALTSTYWKSRYIGARRIASPPTT
jgi:cell wall-associated NlpC family hydrolase